MAWVLDLLAGGRIQRETAEYLARLSAAKIDASRREASGLIAAMASEPPPKVMLGRTEWDAPVSVPLSSLVGGHSFVSGATGSGKSMFALLLVEGMLESFR